MTTKPVAKPVTSDQAVITQLKTLGFTDEFVPTPRRLIVSSGGQPKTGKSAFALTAPSPIVYIDIDIGTEGVIGKFQEEGKEILVYHVRVPKGASQDVYVPMWNDLKARIIKAYQLKKGTMVFDTSSEAYELCRLAAFGKLTQIQPHHYQIVNNEWRDLLRNAYDSSMNTIFIHKMKSVWQNSTDSNGRLKSIKTKDFEIAGFSEMAYLSQVNIVHYREDNENNTTFSIYVQDSRHAPGINGRVISGLPLPKGEKRTGDPLCNFDMLLSLVHDEQ